MLTDVVRPLGEIFNAKDYPALLVGLSAPDDAAIYKLNDSQAIISTMDFFPPVVDDAYDFGAIAAANALSDVYAMGGEPLFAINLAAWPEDLNPSLLADVLRGGAEKVKEAGAAVAGGHTVTDKEPKFGLAVTGVVHPQKYFTKGGAQPGDALILTKPLGTGTITTAIKRQEADNSAALACVQSMKLLNAEAAHAARTLGEAVHAVTDITGFGLLGHAHEMAHLSATAMAIHFDELPWLDGALACARRNIFPGGAGRNERFYSKWVRYDHERLPWQQTLLYDPQTSGGLLLAVAADSATDYLKLARGWHIGQVLSQSDGAGQLVIR